MRPGFCELQQDNGTVIDRTLQGTLSTGAFFGLDDSHIVLMGVTTIAAGQTLQVQCYSGEPKSFLEFLQLIAIEVGARS